MTYYAMAGQVVGAGLNWEAGQRRQRQLAALQAGMDSATAQNDQWSAQDEQALIDRMRGLTAKRYQSQIDLAGRLSGPERDAAGLAGRNASVAARADALKGAAPAPDRSLTGNGAGFAQWNDSATADRQPSVAARAALLDEQRSSRASGDFDRASLDKSANVNIDLNRQAEEAQNANDLRRRRRALLMAAAARQYADPGPTQGQRNLGTWASVVGAAGQAADSYSAQQPQGGDQYDRRMERTRGTIYNPYRSSTPIFTTG